MRTTFVYCDEQDKEGNIKMTINLKNKQEIISKFGKDSKDSGSIEVQVAMLSKKIAELTEHLKINAKDFQIIVIKEPDAKTQSR